MTHKSHHGVISSRKDYLYPSSHFHSNLGCLAGIETLISEQNLFTKNTPNLATVQVPCFYIDEGIDSLALYELHI